MASLTLRNVCKSYPNGFHAVKDFSLDIQDGEFIIFVGPSGCGKSTTLRMIAGLEEISSGELWIDDQLVNFLEPKNRDLSMVFQNYALYPHMSVYDNMAFSLKVRKMDKAEIDRRVREAARILEIEHLLDRKPSALSGGQKQRVAIGSVIVRQPKAYLMDEPLSNLDAKLRTQMRVELSKLHQRLKATIIYVTHDQVEAMTLGTRIVVMKAGVIQQVASPSDLYQNPVNQFVAGFIGSPAMNFIEAKVERQDSDVYLSFSGQRIKMNANCSRKLLDNGYLGREVILGIRPEDLYDEPLFEGNPGYTENQICFPVQVREMLGAEVLLHGELDGTTVAAKLRPGCSIQAGETARLYVDISRIKLFDIRSENNLLYVRSQYDENIRIS
ncbi:MAG: sn-glycerol-3-phosphate ABC transporter ATP-binding protein UgpC [Lachnospiraceae bacterium]|nr:sn-glycerol-3-phosphate ABC transporter ATP-binding protein UgpC [Lachnospiraceae bacterium]MDO5551021.1 sn-glycerol-3-phosphate ABC transporter ATP-binding protein UgpC [Lachnospiraceae bacterium]